MTTVNVTLSDDLNQFIEAQIKSGGFLSTSDYIQKLIARAKQGSDLVERLLLEGLDSGEPILVDHKLRESMRQHVKNSQTG
jgi:antitoxin ParD1/3/4